MEPKVARGFPSRVARALLELYYREGRSYRFLFGAMRGTRMTYDPAVGIQTTLGLSDLSVFRTLQKVFAPGLPPTKTQVAVDLGANRGLYSLFLASTGLFEKVYSFEPNPTVAAQLRQNAQLNGYDAISVEEAAVADKSGVLELNLGQSDFTASLLASPGGRKIVVRTVSLDEFFFGKNSRNGPPPTFIKMDIEGAGVFALPGAAKCLEQVRPLLYLESHNFEEDGEIGRLLMKYDYQAFRIKQGQWVEYGDEVYPEPRGVWGNMLVCPSERQQKVAEALGVPLVRWERKRKAA